MAAHYFELYDIRVCFNPDQVEIRKIFLRRSRENHPDHGGGDPEIAANSLTLSSENNEAYKTLKDKHLRWRYVLEVYGLGITDDDKLPADFLMDMMDWNERIEELELGSDIDLEMLEQDFNKFSDSMEAELETLTETFDRTEQQELLNDIKEICLKQKYLLRLKESIDTFADR